MNYLEFKKTLENYSIEINESQYDLLISFYNLLKETNEHTNLTRIIDKQDVFIKHFLDSLIVLKHVDFNNKKVIDVGSGGGFPGIPLSILCPNTSFTLLEPIGKKANFLKSVKQKLNLNNVTVIQGRAEELTSYRESFDLVISRAVSYLNILLELCVPLCKLGGYVLAMKGERANEEIKDSHNAINVLNVSLEHNFIDELPCEEGKRYNLLFKKNKITNIKYPRNYSQIKKKPL